MTLDSKRILAIDPGTREIGIAVLDLDELVYYAIRTIQDRRTAQGILRQASQFMTDLIATYQPHYLAIEKMFIVQKSAALLSVVAEELKAVARNAGLPIFEHSPTAVRKFLCNSGKATKQDVAKVVVRRYPELARHLTTQTKWEQKYYANIFDAIAVGLRCQSEIANEPLPF
jgi:crossover junction endodeoxyribonuclease RuvC